MSETSEPIINEEKVNMIQEKLEQDSHLRINDDTYNLIQEQKRIAEERSNRLDRYNYDLELKKDARHIQHIEDEPAYKRQGVELENVERSDSEEPISRLTLNENEQELKSNNSFLHDNVD